MFALRSSPSPLVCDLRNSVLPAEPGMMSFKAPRPRRCVDFIGDIYAVGAYYGGVDCRGNGGGGNDGGGGSSSGKNAFSPVVSDYAGVFEAGFDPAQVRASIGHPQPATNDQIVGQRREVVIVAASAEVDRDDLEGGGGEYQRGPSGRQQGLQQAAAEFLEEEEEEVTAAAAGAEPEVEEDIDVFFFEEEAVVEDTIRGGGGDGGWGGRGGSAAAAAPTSAGDAAVIGSRRGDSTGAAGGDCSVPGTGKMPMASTCVATATTVGAGEVVAGAPPRAVSGLGAGVGGAGAAMRKPRVIAPRGTRCVGGGMYRLRLSTSC